MRKSSKIGSNRTNTGWSAFGAVRHAGLAMIIALVIAGCSSISEPPPIGEGDPLLPHPPRPASEWMNGDVGNVAVAGQTILAEDGSPVLLRGSGEDVWGREDGFQFAYQGLGRVGSITVRVDGIEAVHEWSKVGVMIRESLEPGARNAMLHITEGNGAVLQARYESAGETVDWRDDLSLMRHSPARTPWWLRLERDGDVVRGWHSADGEAWTQLESLELALPDQVLVGVAVTSHLNGEVAAGTFAELTTSDTVWTEPGPEPQPNPNPDPEPSPEPSPDPEPDPEPEPEPTPSPEPGPSPEPEPEPSPEPEPIPVPVPGPTTTVTYSVDGSTNFPNPERGWYGHGGAPSNYQQVANQGFTLAHRNVRLDAYRTQALPTSFLNTLRSDLEALRGSGIKLILRFAYNFGFESDAPLSYVLMHIDQVTPILQEYSDVIAALQAGFIGAWGEWHASTNNLLTLENRRAITSALLDAIDESRMIQIRYPYRARDLFDPPTAEQAFNNGDASRVGQLNDCFLSSANDGGTYTSQQDYDYARYVTALTVMGGETCDIAGLSSRNDCVTALTELERYHWDYLNHGFYGAIISKWRTQGCYDEISRRLGYRYNMTQTTSATSVQAGQTLALNVTMQNQGWGKLFNPRPLNIVLQPVGGGAPVTLTAYQDARRVLPLAGESATIPIQVQVPAGTPSGSYQLHLGLPDAASTLNNDARYSIRLANNGTWNQNTGYNNLNITIQVN